MLEGLYKILNSITGFTDKVTYRAFPVGEAPALPFICYLVTNSDNFFADDVVTHQILDVDVELYTKNKDLASESAIESALNDNKIPWNKTEDYIDSEQCYMITYSIRLV